MRRFFILRKGLALNLLLLTISTCLSLMIGEITIRIIDSIKNSKYEWEPTFEFSSARHHRLIPNVQSYHKELEYEYHWKNNSLGMRDYERSEKKDTGTFRILFLGDSMVQGWGVPIEQSMVAVLEKNLNKTKRTKKIEILNAGIFGYSPFLEYLFIKELIPATGSDLVMLGLFIGNDIGDDFFYTRQVILNVKDSSFYFKENNLYPWTDLDELTEATVKKSRFEGLSSGSFFAQYINAIWNKAEPILTKSRLFNKVKKIFVEDERQVIQNRNRIMRQLVEKHKDDIRINLGLINYPVLTKEQRLKYWSISKQYIAAISNYCRKWNVPVVLVVIPGDGTPDFSEPFDIIDQFANDLEIRVIHLREELLKDTRQREYPLDGHWNSYGNKLVAGIIERKLRALAVLPDVSN